MTAPTTTERPPDPLPHVLKALAERPDLANWLRDTNPRPTPRTGENPA